jgi:hypothetical protein
MNGILNGGWDFVVAAYVISGAILAIYSIHTFLKFRQLVAGNTKGVSQ